MARQVVGEGKMLEPEREHSQGDLIPSSPWLPPGARAAVGKEVAGQANWVGGRMGGWDGRVGTRWMESVDGGRGRRGGGRGRPALVLAWGCGPHCFGGQLVVGACRSRRVSCCPSLQNEGIEAGPEGGEDNGER